MQDKISPLQALFTGRAFIEGFPLGAIALRERCPGVVKKQVRQCPRVLRPRIPSPRNCSRVMSTMSAEKSALDIVSQIRSRRFVRSLRTQSSLLSGATQSTPARLETAFPLARIHCSEIDIAPREAREASPERRGRRWEPIMAVLPRLMGARQHESTEQGCSQTRCS